MPKCFLKISSKNKRLKMINVMGGMFKSNWTTSVPKSIPRFVLDKVRLLLLSEMCYYNSLTTNGFRNFTSLGIQFQEKDPDNCTNFFTLGYLIRHAIKMYKKICIVQLFKAYSYSVKIGRRWICRLNSLKHTLVP